MTDTEEMLNAKRVKQHLLCISLKSEME